MGWYIGDFLLFLGIPIIPGVATNEVMVNFSRWNVRHARKYFEQQGLAAAIWPRDNPILIGVNRPGETGEQLFT